uniref:Uncharacterized protein n=1 Tax=Cryptosporidium parvum TaxID=5807 RepID=F0X5S5_CRYPV
MEIEIIQGIYFSILPEITTVNIKENRPQIKYTIMVEETLRFKYVPAINKLDERVKNLNEILPIKIQSIILQKIVQDPIIMLNH